MDAVILAAGRNTRLTNYLPEFHKPLLPSMTTDYLKNPKSLLRNAAELAIEAGVERPVVVASPLNAFALHKDLEGLPVDMVVQREPKGPGEALRVGLAFKENDHPSSRVLVLLSDNTMTSHDVYLVCETGEYTIGVRSLHHDEAGRFTWYDPDERRWREKESIPDRLSKVDCWVGPFMGDRDAMEYELRKAKPINGEYLIGPHLDRLTNVGYRVPVSSRDVGTEESYLAYMKGEL